MLPIGGATPTPPPPPPAPTDALELGEEDQQGFQAKVRAMSLFFVDRITKFEDIASRLSIPVDQVREWLDGQPMSHGSEHSPVSSPLTPGHHTHHTHHTHHHHAHQQHAHQQHAHQHPHVVSLSQVGPSAVQLGHVQLAGTSSLDDSSSSDDDDDDDSSSVHSSPGGKSRRSRRTNKEVKNLKERFKELYKSRLHNTTELSMQLNVDPRQVRKWIKELIPPEERAKGKRRSTNEIKALKSRFRQLYNEKKATTNTTELAAQLHVNPRQVRKWIKELHYGSAAAAAAAAAAAGAASANGAAVGGSPPVHTGVHPSHTGVHPSHTGHPGHAGVHSVHSVVHPALPHPHSHVSHTHPHVSHTHPHVSHSHSHPHVSHSHPHVGHVTGPPPNATSSSAASSAPPSMLVMSPGPPPVAAHQLPPHVLTTSPQPVSPSALCRTVPVSVMDHVSAALHPLAVPQPVPPLPLDVKTDDLLAVTR